VLGAQVDVRDTYQFTPLHSAANGGHVQTIQKLIQFNHDVDVKDYLGVHLFPIAWPTLLACRMRLFFEQTGQQSHLSFIQ
jgi:hypothetical protein